MRARWADLATLAALTALLAGCSSGGGAPHPSPSSTGSPSSGSTAKPKILVGARARDITFAQMNSEIGPVRATRVFYTKLPASFDTTMFPRDVKVIVSYKDPSANTAAYVRSIPADANVEMAFHHEPEGLKDFPGPPNVAGPRFVKAFTTQAQLIRAANPKIRVAFIGGSYQYRPTGGRGIGGFFIPSTADDYYLDSYQRIRIIPAAEDPRIQNFIAELTKKDLSFNGFTEYGRGLTPPGAPSSAAEAAARAKVIATDAAWLQAQPKVNLWIYWYTPALASGAQWRFTDPASVKAWRAQSSAR